MATEIIPGLYVGGKHDVECARWTHILNLWRKELPAHVDMAMRAGAAHYLHVPFHDLPEEEFRMITELRRILRFLDAAMACTDARVLIHCRKGISRSATVCAAFLLHKAQQGSSSSASGGGGSSSGSSSSSSSSARPGSMLGLDQTLAYMRERRPQVQPNVGFMRFLEWYSQHVHAFAASSSGSGDAALLQSAMAAAGLPYPMPPPGPPVAAPAGALVHAGSAAQQQQLLQQQHQHMLYQQQYYQQQQLQHQQHLQHQQQFQHQQHQQQQHLHQQQHQQQHQLQQHQHLQQAPSSLAPRRPWGF